MKFAFSAILTTLALAAGVLAVPTGPPAPGTQPGCGPKGCHNPTGTFGLKRDNRAYHSLCDHHSHSTKIYSRPRVCFKASGKLEKLLSAPNPEKLDGYIDGSDTSFVLFSSQIVTVDEKLQVKVTKPKLKSQRHMGCGHVKIWQLPEWKLIFDEVWCPGHQDPIQL